MWEFKETRQMIYLLKMQLLFHHPTTVIPGLISKGIKDLMLSRTRPVLLVKLGKPKVFIILSTIQTITDLLGSRILTLISNKCTTMHCTIFFTRFATALIFNLYLLTENIGMGISNRLFIVSMSR